MKIEITRTSYCKACEIAERPKTDDVYAVKGSRGWHVLSVEYNRPDIVPYGYTPHIFTLEKSSNGFVYGYKVCGMNDCGLDIRHNPESETNTKAVPYLIYHNHRTQFKMTIADWNALILNKDFGYRIDE